jgi:hypothetical protein
MNFNQIQSKNKNHIILKIQIYQEMKDKNSQIMRNYYNQFMKNKNILEMKELKCHIFLSNKKLFFYKIKIQILLKLR